MNCPLCLGPNVLLNEVIEVVNVVEIYQNGPLPNLGIDVASEFGDLKEIRFLHCQDCDLRFFDPMVTGSEEFYEQLQGFTWYYRDEKDEYHFARQFIRESDAILEIGSGKGAFAKMIPTRHYTGLEFSRRAIEAAAHDGIEVLNQSIQKHAESHECQYDVVCGFQVLEHVSDTYSFIESSVACLKPGGLLVFSVPSYDSFVSLVVNNATNMPPHHVTWWSDKCLESIAGIFNLERVGIHHEQMMNSYEPTYAFTLALITLKNILNEDRKLVDLSAKHRALEKIARFGGKVLEHNMLDPRVLPSGHSVNAVFRKPLVTD